MSQSKEYYRLTCYSSTGRQINFPYAVSNVLQQETEFRGRAERISNGDVDVLMIPARLYSKELHAKILELGNEQELFIEHGVMERSGFRSTSDQPRAIAMLNAKKFPTEAELEKNKPWYERFFGSTTGTIATMVAIIGGAGTLHFGALDEGISAQKQPPEPAAELQNGLSSQAHAKR